MVTPRSSSSITCPRTELGDVPVAWRMSGGSIRLGRHRSTCLSPTPNLDEIGRLVESLHGLGLEPILVGGMALVVIGSRRVRATSTSCGLELASRLDEAGDVTATIDDRRVAAIRLRVDAPASAYYFNRRPGCVSTSCRLSRSASEADLLRLERIAYEGRSSAEDAADIPFLERRLLRT